MFGIFGSDAQLGIDIGNSIRAAQYKDNTFKTKEYQDLSTQIKEDFNTKDLVTAIDSNQIRIKFLDVPENLSENEIEQMIELEFEEPNLILQYEIIDFFADKYIIALAVDKELIQDKFDQMKELGFKPQVIETEFHANIRYLYQQHPNLQQTVSLIDIGKNKTDLIIAKNSQPVFIRSFGFAGQHISERLAKINDMTIEEAEEYKKTEIETDDLKLVLEEIRTQIYSSLDYFQSEYRGTVSKLFLTGGSSKVKGLKEYLENQVGITTQRLEESEFSVAKGLALRVKND
ncbi:pilus assembly protein PilM [Halanaerobacter jeridensis]|uniref:Type IV pilus assembly protein PilM n=1 Tax=Halanaerobacter jeridensis TaxID=706427 RepID=A0A938XQ84_9FIRM|nr:pilus assembly protein PilM [Halanaerobacter jeridensis]MBM7555295.1 type IV pilus assembly protein PilM [Halanaerobacter jeridensis]